MEHFLFAPGGLDAPGDTFVNQLFGDRPKQQRADRRNVPMDGERVELPAAFAGALLEIFNAPSHQRRSDRFEFTHALRATPLDKGSEPPFLPLGGLCGPVFGVPEFCGCFAEEHRVVSFQELRMLCRGLLP